MKTSTLLRCGVLAGLLAAVAAVALTLGATRTFADNYGGDEGGYIYACGTSGRTIVAAQLEYESPVCNARLVRFYAYRYDPSGCAGVYDAWVAYINPPTGIDWRWHHQYCIDGLYHWSAQMALHSMYAREVINGPAGTDWQINLYR
jgi:hypothetical protein